MIRENVLYEMIRKRKSFHLFWNVGNETLSEEELADIRKAYEELTPLIPEIRTAVRIVPAGETNCRNGAEYCILMYSEKKEGYLQNIGYLGEQLDLYLVSKDIGTLWFGIGRTDEKPLDDGMTYVIMIAVKKVSDRTKYRRDMFKSKRKPADELWEGEQIPGVTDIVRFAPSACNSQPWAIKNTGGTLSVYRVRKPGKVGIIPAGKIPFYNRIDIGIFLYFMDLCLNESGIGFERELCQDDGTGEGRILNAVYRTGGSK